MDTQELIERDLAHVWHPCSQMKEYESFRPAVVVGAEGSYLKLADGSTLIDAISSWWCKPLGHGHPELKAALHAQIEKFEHVMLAQITYPEVVELSERLSTLMPGLTKVMYASDGSCAVEIALKMSLHSRQIRGQKRNQFMALKNGYHGETSGALSVSDLGIYRRPYESMLFGACFLDKIPYVSGREDPLWHDCSAIWPEIELQLNRYKDSLTAIILEPIVQGAGGMLIYSADFLTRLSQFARENDIHLIADEIMTGFARTGKMLACEHANIRPDFLCLSKALTAGFLPMSAVLTSDEMYGNFYGDSHEQKAFLHSHTYTGNALAVAIALKFTELMHSENLVEKATALESKMRDYFEQMAKSTGKLSNIRVIGAIAAADCSIDTKKIFQSAIKKGALLRPLGNTIYWLPPINISDETLEKLAIITEASIVGVKS
jgi:adenosylmethionine-8-amino-7-oxononanoate aminotransferase